MLLQPVDDETIRREQAQQGIVVDGLQRADPGVELLLGELYLQDAEALVPKRRFGRQNIPQEAGGGRMTTKKGQLTRAVYTLSSDAARCVIHSLPRSENAPTYGRLC